MKVGDMEINNGGLYLVFPDLTRIEFSRQAVERITKEFWDDPQRISPAAREAIDFKRCDRCPLRGKDDICDAIRPVLPLVKSMDKYTSFGEVTAYYKEDDSELVHVADMSIQEALRDISILSLTQYCKLGAKYRRYFYGIMPLMNGQDIAIRLYLNVYYCHEGKKDAVDDVLSEFRDDIFMTTSNQVKRLRYITKSDVFPNAFVATQIITELLTMNIAELVKRQLGVI
jgi:hypothetical protein